VALAWLGMPVVLLWTWRRRNGDEWRLLVPLLVHHLGTAAFSLIDFQLHGDLFVLLHSAAFFLGALWVAVHGRLVARLSSPRGRLILAAAVLLLAVLAARPSVLRPRFHLANPFAGADATLADQRAVAGLVAERLGDSRPAFLEHAELLFLMRRENALPVVYWTPATWAHFREPGEDGAATALRLLSDTEARVFALPARIRDDPRVAELFRLQPLASDGQRYVVVLASRLPAGAASAPRGAAPAPDQSAR
jgi:hypothetical protein